MGCRTLMKNWREYCCGQGCSEDKRNEFNKKRVKIVPITDNLIDEKKNEQVSNLADNLTGETKEYIQKSLSSNSKTSLWKDFNLDHFEINIRYCHRETKLKVKKNILLAKSLLNLLNCKNLQKWKEDFLKMVTL